MPNIIAPEPEIILPEDFIKSEIDCALFDFDGLILSAETDFLAEKDGFFAATGHELLFQDTVDMAGKRWQECAPELMARAIRRNSSGKTPAEIDAEIAQMRAEEPPTGDMGPRTKIFRQVKDGWLANNPDKIKARPGIIEVIKFLHSIGMPMAIVTNSPRHKVEKLCLPPMGLEGAFIKVFDATDFPEKRQQKPLAYPWLVALADMPASGDPRKCLVFDDGFKQIVGAKTVGLKHVFAPESEQQVENEFAQKIMRMPISEGIAMPVNAPFDLELLQKVFNFMPSRRARALKYAPTGPIGGGAQ